MSRSRIVQLLVAAAVAVVCGAALSSAHAQDNPLHDIQKKQREIFERVAPAVVFITRKDFSFLGGILTLGGLVALGLIVAGVLFGFTLGLLFSGFMVALACGAILYDTSKILHSYPPDRHVAASMELFASVAILFWYVLRILMHFSWR